MKTTSKWRWPQNIYDLKIEDNLKNEHNLKNEDDLKSEDDLKHADNFFITPPSQSELQKPDKLRAYYQLF